MSEKDLVAKTDKTISELVYDKIELQKAYNYYNCKRDEEQFKYLEDNYGIGQPTSVQFIPLIRKHVDALIGEYLDTPILPKVSCKDAETINNIFREKQVKISQEVHDLLAANLKRNILRTNNNKNMIDLNIKEQLDKLIEDINENFISKYEIAGQNIVNYIIQSRNIDLKNKLRQLLLDLLVGGYAYYKVIPSEHNIQIEVEDPRNTFVDYNYDSPYIKNSYRSVVRRFLTKHEILSKYGKDLSRDEVQDIKNNWNNYGMESDSYYVRNFSNNGVPATDGIRAGQEITPGMPGNRKYFDNNIIPVYEVEWLETDKHFVMQRYSTVRIGNNIYILNGEDEDVVRTKDTPEKCYLRLNGIYYNNRNDEPFSLVATCMSLQDKYDLSIFYRDALLATGGTVGEWVNLPTIPAFLGEKMPERVAKWLAYKKQGLGLIDTSQEGQVNTGQAPLNTMFNGFDDTIKSQAVQAIQMVIDSIEAQASSITGVFRERLNGIQQRDAVTNVQVSVNNSFTVTKQWFFEMDLLLEEMLIDSLNCAKVAYKDGITGVLILGNKLQKIFTALPEHYTVTDFDVHILTSSEIIKQMEQIKQLIPDFIKGNMVGPEILMEIITSQSLSEMKSIVNKSLKKQKAENNQIQQLTQQLEEAQNNLQQMQQQLQQAQSKIESLNESKLQLEQTKMQLQNQVDMFKAKTDRAYKENVAKNDDKRTEIELLQLHDGNPYNDKIRQV